MKTALAYAALSWFVAFALVPAGALAAGNSALSMLAEITLDIDHDGKLDRAVMVQDPASIYADLYIYLGAGAEPLDLSRRPSFVKKNLTTDAVFGLASNGKGSLIVKYGHMGSNQYETRLTIVDRDGEFLVAGFAQDWDMRAGIGSCDINFLTGKGVASQGLAKSKAIRGKFTAIKLADWSADHRPQACL